MQQRFADWWNEEEYLAPALVGALFALAVGATILALLVGWRPGPVAIFLAQLAAAVIAAVAIVWLLAERARQQLAAAPLLERISDLEAEVEAARRQHAQTERRLRYVDETAAAHSQTLFGEVLDAEQTIAALAEGYTQFSATIAALREEYQQRTEQDQRVRDVLSEAFPLPAGKTYTLFELAQQLVSHAAFNKGWAEQTSQELETALAKANSLQAAFDALPPVPVVTPVPWPELLDTCRKGNPAGNKRHPQYLAGTWKTVIQQRASAMGLALVRFGDT